jgi:glycosyltransferase involved in cell wall biosynthesis
MTTDMELMRPYVDIIPIDLTGPRPTRPRFFARLLRALVVDNARAVFAYFASGEYTLHMAVLLRVLGRGLIIATGGTDSTYVEDIDFGELKSSTDRRRFAWTMRLAHSVLAFSDASKADILRFGRPRRIRTAYMCVDSNRFTPGTVFRPRRAITVAAAISGQAVLQKGVAPFLEAAKLAPDVEFVVVGRCVDEATQRLRDHAPSNVRFVDRFLEPAAYVEQLQSAAIYVQASGHEGFGVCLAEAMACGCVPVVANRYSLPEVVGSTGILVPFNDAVALAEAIRRGLTEPERGLAARRRVVELFTPQRRQLVLREELEAVVGGSLGCESDTVT